MTTANATRFQYDFLTGPSKEVDQPPCDCKHRSQFTNALALSPRVGFIFAFKNE